MLSVDLRDRIRLTPRSSEPFVESRQCDYEAGCFSSIFWPLKVYVLRQHTVWISLAMYPKLPKGVGRWESHHREGVRALKELFLIGDTLNGLLKSLEQALKVTFSPQEIDRILTDSENDQVSSKSYCLFDSGALMVVGTVDECEPETIWIEVRGKRHHEKAFQEVVNEIRLLLGPGHPLR